MSRTRRIRTNASAQTESVLAPPAPSAPEESSRAASGNAERLERLEVLLKISRIINKSLDPKKVLHALLREVVRITRATSGSIAMLDSERGVLDIVAAHNIPASIWKHLKLHLGVGITGWAAYSGTPVRAADVRRNSHYVQVKPDIRSELAVPLLLDGRVTGVINVDSARRAAFSAADEDLLVAVANHSARIIEMARLAAAERRHAQEVESLMSFGRTLIAPLPIAGLFREVAEQGRRLARADVCLLALFEGQDVRRRLILRAISSAENSLATTVSSPDGDPTALDETPLAQAAQLGRPVACPDLFHAEGAPLPESLRAENAMSMLAVPVVFQGRTEGVLATLFDRARRFEEREIHLLELLAGQFAVGLENARRYERIAAMEESLRRTDRFALLGSLAAEIAHDIRNPITIIHMLLHPICEAATDKTHQRDLAIVMEKLDRINRIVDQTLDLARGREIVFEPVRVGELLDDLLLFLRYKTDQAGVRLHKRIASGLPEIAGDRGQLQQVFMNLIMNALQAMERGGELSVRALERPGENGEPGVLVTVSDTGPGIREADLARLFEPFFTTRTAGTGLGLFISRKIVTNHRGRIGLRPNAGRGTTATVWLPSLAAERPQMQASPQNGASDSGVESSGEPTEIVEMSGAPSALGTPDAPGARKNQPNMGGTQ